jgi:hypothetical protein
VVAAATTRSHPLTIIAQTLPNRGQDKPMPMYHGSGFGWLPFGNIKEVSVSITEQ